jgi:glycolate oxidase iron-sulfur subunit
MRVALMTGCAQKALNTDINDATIRLLRRLGCRGGDPAGHGVLRGADASHGQVRTCRTGRRREHPRLEAEKDGAGLDAIVINTSGCGTTVKDYGHMFRNDPFARDAATVAEIARMCRR